MQITFDNPTVRRSLVELKSYALAYPVDLRGLTQADVSRLQPVGDNPRHVVINGTARIVYSVEIQPDARMGQCHHLSISKVPLVPFPGERDIHRASPAVVDFIMGQLGMGSLQDGNPKRHLSFEGLAVNIVQPMTSEPLADPLRP